MSHNFKVLDAPSDDFDPSMELWRYIRLSALFLLLEKNQIYIPSLAELQKQDPLECTILSEQALTFLENLSSEDQKWLRDKIPPDQDVFEKLSPNPNNQPKAIWLRELSKRRAAWCWHMDSIESMAMWHIYGNHGVAIKTTPRRIDECLFKTVGLVVPARIAKIEYPRERKDTTAEWPYLVKLAAYGHEKEARVIFPIPNGRDDKGLMLHIDAVQLIERIVITPMMLEDEAFALLETIRGKTDIETKVSLCQSSYPEEQEDWRQFRAQRIPIRPWLSDEDPSCLKIDFSAKSKS